MEVNDSAIGHMNVKGKMSYINQQAWQGSLAEVGVERGPVHVQGHFCKSCNTQSSCPRPRVILTPEWMHITSASLHCKNGWEMGRKCWRRQNNTFLTWYIEAKKLNFFNVFFLLIDCLKFNPISAALVHIHGEFSF